MPKLKEDNRARLVQAAVKATYQYGFGTTSIADIAKEAKIPLGNVYYYFKTKDEIGEAVIQFRIDRFRRILAELDKMPSPKERLCSFVHIKIETRERLARFGCPVGSMCSELHKHRGTVAKKSAALFTEGLAWMEKQFKEIGKGKESYGLAVHLMSALQGVSVLTHTFHDPSLVDMEAARLKKWICSL